MSVEGKIREDKDYVRGRGQRNTRETRTLFTGISISLAWRLDREMRRRLIAGQCKMQTADCGLQTVDQG